MRARRFIYKLNGKLPSPLLTGSIIRNNRCKWLEVDNNWDEFSRSVCLKSHHDYLRRVGAYSYSL